MVSIVDTTKTSASYSCMAWGSKWKEFFPHGIVFVDVRHSGAFEVATQSGRSENIAGQERKFPLSLLFVACIVYAVREATGHERKEGRVKSR